MYLTLSKRFEISLSYRWCRPDWPEDKNRDVYGRLAGGEHGFGANMTAFFVFTGPVDEKTGMIINVTIVKERIKKLMAARYDHKFLNRDTPPFTEIAPTPENIVRALFDDAKILFDDVPAELIACHLDIPPDAAATAFACGHKTSDGFVGVGPRLEGLLTGYQPTAKPYAPIASVLEAAKRKGKATGIVVTCRISHATPAGFASHIHDRGLDNDITEQMVYNNIDVVFGGGARHLIDGDGNRPFGG